MRMTTSRSEYDSDSLECEVVQNDSDGDSADGLTIGPSKALECCLRLSSFLSYSTTVTN